MAPLPTGASVCPLPLGPADLYTLGYGGYEAWQAGRMLRGGLRFVPGARYPGQIIVYGTWEARRAAGLSPFLTHSRWTHPALIRYLSPGVAFSRELLSRSTGVGVALAVGWDVYEYGWGSKREVGLASPEFAAALTVDVAASALLPAAGAAIGAALSPLCGPYAPICMLAGVALGSGGTFVFSQNALGLREWSIEAVRSFYEWILVPPATPELQEEQWYDWPNIPGP
jgi:hypothetical protein